MELFGINGWEFVLLIVLAIVILGPERLPEYAAKLGQGVRKLRMMAEGAKDQLKDQLGPEYNDINWRQYDPRQYDPRRIVREALAEPIESFRELGNDLKPESLLGGHSGEETGDGPSDSAPPVEPEGQAGHTAYLAPTQWDPARPTPYDLDAT